MSTLSAQKKERIYDLYKILVDNPKEYSKLNRKQMLEEIIYAYDVYDMCTLRELNFLSQLLNGESSMDTIEYQFENETLEKKLLVLDGKVVDEFKSMIEVVLENLDVQKKEAEDRNLAIAVGYIRLMGIASQEELNVLQSHQEYQNRKLFTYYVERIDSNFVYREDVDVLKELLSQKDKNKILRSRRFSYDTYISYFYRGYDASNIEVKKFFDLFEELFSQEENRNIALNAIEKSVLCDMNRNIAKVIVSSFDCASDELMERFDYVLDQMPSGALLGYCKKDLKLACSKNEYVDRKCRNRENEALALISPKSTRNFLKMYFSILEFVNEELNLFPGLAIKATDSTIMPAVNEIIARFWENKDAWIDAYCQKNPLNLSLQNLNVAKDFKKGIRKSFMVYGYEDGYTLFVDEERVYYVKGLADRVDHLIANNEYPIFVQTCLLPYHGDIVYAASLELFFGDLDEYDLDRYDCIKELV